MNKARRMVFLPDYQAPFEDRKLVKALARFVGEYTPDEVVHIGDLVDFPQPSRWNKDTRGEFEGSIYEDSEYTKRTILEPLRRAYDGPIGVLEGNHDLRPREYLNKHAPALAGEAAKVFNFENLLDFDGFGITKLPDFYDFAPGWVATHGHLGGIRMTQKAGQTALNAAERFTKSVICGHTHRLAQMSVSRGYDGQIHQTLTGVEVGNAMDMRQAQYLKRSTANWQQGFTILHVDGKNVQVSLIPVVGRRFIVEGEVFNV